MEPVVASPVSACGSELSLASAAHDDHDAADFPEGADRGTSHVGKCGGMSRPIQASPDTIPGAGRGGGATPAAELRGVCTITEEEAVIIFRKILFRYGELIRLSPGGGGRCGRERGMGGQDGLRAGADAR